MIGKQSDEQPALKKLGTAPDFELKDTQGELVRLSAYTRRGPVVLVLLRGFI